MGTSASTTRLTRKAQTAGSSALLSWRRVGLTVGTIGWMAAMVAFVISIVTAFAVARSATKSEVAALEVLSFGLAIAALGTGKTGIVLVLRGILRRIGLRIDAIKEALPQLVPTQAPDGRPVSAGIVKTAHGRVRVTAHRLEPLFVHGMARLFWEPMLLMGLMALYGGLLIALIATGATDPASARSLKAWVQGTQFLGEGFLLSAISFALGTILAAIRTGGGEVQELLKAPVRTLLMPATGKIFLGLMMLGLMVELVQFVLYGYVASVQDVAMYTAYSTWLGPFREFGLGVLLSGVVLALATIARALDFQFARVRELITTGR
jgi:hypothetical protein